MKQAKGQAQGIKGTFKQRKKLRGHFGKVYAMHWASDAERVVRTRELDYEF